MGVLSSETRRNHKRSRVLLKAVVRAGDWEIEVRIRDLSVKGALLEGERRPVVGRAVELVRGDLCAPCVVTWVEEERFGIEFVAPITEAEVLEHIGRRLRVSAPASYRRPGLAQAALRKGELKLVDRWSQPPPHEAFGE